MPIRPENLHRYPADWQSIRYRILERARHRCEGSPDYPACRLQNGAWGYWEGGKFHRVNKRGMLDALKSEHPGKWIKPPLWWCGEKVIEIVLTVAHLDHTPENCDDANLRAWCQRCHLNYDRQHHQQTAYRTRREGKAAGDLFDHMDGGQHVH